MVQVHHAILTSVSGSDDRVKTEPLSDLAIQWLFANQVLEAEAIKNRALEHHTACK
jgi:hypothetical protein